MRLQEYPPQDPPAAHAVKYREACMAGSLGVPFREFRFGDDPHQSVAVYEPAKPSGTLYAFMHGGGWTNGYKETMAFMAPALLAHGITFASIGYRLAPAHVFPAGFEDCMHGLQRILERAGEFGIDRRKVAIGGHSSGGHYAALLAVKRDWQAGVGLAADTIKACLPVSGVYRFGEGSGLSARPRFLGPEGNGADTASSPILQVQGTPPPFFMVWGDNDFPHLRVQAREMAAHLQSRGGELVALELSGRDHFTTHLSCAEPEGPWLPRALEFLRRHAGG